MIAFDFDDIETWGPALREVISDLLPDGVDEVLHAGPRDDNEDAVDRLFDIADRRILVAKTADWLRSSPIVGYHGSRLTPDEIVSVRKDGLKSLVAAEREARMASVLSYHPRWKEIAPTLSAAVDLVGKGNHVGHREGQVHLTLSKSGLMYGFNHYLIEGSEFDGHVAMHLLQDEGRKMMRGHGSPVLFRVSVPAEAAFAACNPFGVREEPQPVLYALRAWSQWISTGSFNAKSFRLDAGMIFYSSVPADWIVETISINESEIIKFYRR